MKRGVAWRQKIRQFTWALGLWALLAARPAAAAPTCFPVGGGGVPFQPGLPDWWTGSAPYDDPRWIHSYGYSAGPESFNALLDTTGGSKALVLRWHVTGDAGGAAPGDQVWVGFYNPTTTVGTVLQFTRDALANTTAGGVGCRRHDGERLDPDRNRGLVQQPRCRRRSRRRRAWMRSATTAALPVTCNEWIIRVRVPTTAAAGGVDIGDTFAMWFELDADHGGTATTDVLEVPAGRSHRRSDRAATHVPAAAGRWRLGGLDRHRRHGRGDLRAGSRPGVRGHHRRQRAWQRDDDRHQQHQHLPRQAHQRDAGDLRGQRRSGAPPHGQLGFLFGGEPAVGSGPRSKLRSRHGLQHADGGDWCALRSALQLDADAGPAVRLRPCERLHA